MSAPTVPARMVRPNPSAPSPRERAVARVNALLCDWCDQSIAARLCRCPKEPRP